MTRNVKSVVLYVNVLEPGTPGEEPHWEDVAAAQGPQEWFTTTEAAAYLRTTPKALRMRIARGAITPDSWGGRGRSREHMFRRATLDAHYTTGAKPEPARSRR